MSLYEHSKTLERSYLLFLIGVFVFGLIVYLNEGLAMGLLVVGLLTWATILAIRKFGGVNRKVIIALFLLAIITHLGASAFVHYAEFYPFGTGTKQGDQSLYHLSAIAIAEDFRQGDFSIATIQKNINDYSLIQSYSAIVGGLYAVTVPDQFVGKAFNAWLVAISILLVFFIALEIGVSKKRAFITGLIANIYPSYLYFGSLLIREALVVSLALFSLFLIIRAVKSFSWRTFFLFSITLFTLVHFRFYIGFIALFVFVLSFLFLSNSDWKQKLRYGIIVISLLGFVPQMLGHGYYGISTIIFHAQPERVELYREYSYVVPVDRANSLMLLEILSDPERNIEDLRKGDEEEIKRKTPGSTVIVGAGLDSPLSFVRNFFISFLFVSVGPFPWHLRFARHLFTLPETIPWYILLFFIIKGVWISRKQWRVILPIILMSVGILATIAWLIDNFGIYTRLRMPAFFALLPLISLYPFSSRIFRFFEKKLDDLYKLLSL